MPLPQVLDPEATMTALLPPQEPDYELIAMKIGLMFAGESPEECARLIPKLANFLRKTFSRPSAALTDEEVKAFKRHKDAIRGLLAETPGIRSREIEVVFAREVLDEPIPRRLSTLPAAGDTRPAAQGLREAEARGFEKALRAAEFEQGMGGNQHAIISRLTKDLSSLAALHPEEPGR